jgi:NTP pyrophosphatase (non-canonical NTP hydrolase)
MIDEVMKWRTDFSIQTTKAGAMLGLSEEYIELKEAYDNYINSLRVDGNPDAESVNGLKKEWADVFFTLVQFAHVFGINMEQSIKAVLESNYTKRMTVEEYKQLYPDGNSDAFPVTKDGYVYLYDADFKLLKGPKYKPVDWFKI